MTLITFIVAALAMTTRHASAMNYVSTYISLGSSPSASASSDAETADRTECPTATAGLANHPIADIRSGITGDPEPTFWLQLGTCVPLSLAHDNGAAFAGLQAYYNATHDEEANTIRFRYFCNADCSLCALDHTYTLGTCTADVGGNATNDRVFVQITTPILVRRNVVLAFGRIMDYDELKLELTNATTRKALLGVNNIVVTEQYADTDCGATSTYPVTIRTGVPLDSDDQASSADCFSGLDDTFSFAVACGYQATGSFFAIQVTATKGSNCTGDDRDINYCSLPAWPAVNATADYVQTRCQAICPTDSVPNQVSTRSFCVANNVWPAVVDDQTCPHPTFPGCAGSGSTTSGSVSGSGSGSGSGTGSTTASADSSASAVVASSLFLATGLLAAFLL